MNNTSWQKARSRSNLPQARVHDLKHTIVIDNPNFRAGDKPLRELPDADLGRMVASLAQGLISDRGLAAIAMSWPYLNVNGVGAQEIIDEVKRRKVNFSDCLLP